MTSNAAEPSDARPLPPGWRRVRLGEVCSLVNGDAYKPSDWNTSGTPIVRIQNLNDASKPFNYWGGPLDDRVVVDADELLLAWSGTPGTSFGAHIWHGARAVLNQHIFRVDLDEQKAVREWAVFAINHELEVLIGKAHGGVGLRHVTKGVVESLEVPLPPLPEQRRIAAILNAQMAAVERARAAAEARLEAANAMRGACLRATFESRVADKWPRTRLESLSSLIIDGPHVTPNYEAAGVPFLTVRNIVSRRIDLSNVSYVSEEDHEAFASRGLAERGDILYTKDGTLGIPCLVDTDARFSFFVSVALIKLRRDRVFPEFIAMALESPHVLAQVERLGAGAGLKHMVLKSIRSLLVPVPDLREQEALVASLRAQLSLAEKMRSAVEDEVSAFRALLPALLRRAFGGEL